jgi:hypothetical protein
LFTDTDVEATDFFEGQNYRGGIPRNDGQMTPIDEVSQETNESVQMNNFSSVGFTHNFGLVTDNASVYSNNSRNFQMPEKDLIMEISRQRDQMLTTDTKSATDGDRRNSTPASGNNRGSFIEI